MGEETIVLTDEVHRFREHIKSVHELEMFYGDETLQGLITHTTELINNLEGFDYLLKNEDPEIEEEGEEGA